MIEFVPIGISTAVLVLSYLGYKRKDSERDQKCDISIAVLETRIDNHSESLIRIESKIDDLIERLL